MPRKHENISGCDPPADLLRGFHNKNGGGGGRGTIFDVVIASLPKTVGSEKDEGARKVKEKKVDQHNNRGSGMQQQQPLVRTEGSDREYVMCVRDDDVLEATALHRLRML